LCLKAKPEYSAELRQIFKDDPSPSFAVIDAVGGGLNFPQLRATLKAESSIDILLALLAPTEAQQQALKVSDRWVAEAKEFLKTTIGLNLKTRGKTWSSIADELWRFVLFSEFVFDLPITLPDSLQGVPHASSQVDIMINEVCDRLSLPNGKHQRLRPVQHLLCLLTRNLCNLAIARKFRLNKNFTGQIH
jgi:hypothetical protein